MKRLLHLLLLWLCASVSADAAQVVFSEIMYHPAGTKPEFIEVWNISKTPQDIAKWKFTDGVSYEFPDFAAGSPSTTFLKPLERIVISAADEATTRSAYGIPASVRIYGPWVGVLDNAGEKVTLRDKNGTPVCTVDYKDGGRWPKAADGAGHSLVLKNENRAIDDPRVWVASNYTGGTPGGSEFLGPEPFPNPEVGVGQSAVMVNYGDVWKYNIPLADPGTSWRGLAFDDSSWGSGPGLFGFESNATPPPPGFQTPFTNQGRITFLFRKNFTFNGNPAGVSYAIDQILDDGGTYYLNGQLLNSSRHTPGAWDNTAVNVGDSVEELDALSGAANGLQSGNNVLSVEVHQSGSGSADLVFGARFKLSSPSSVVINEVKPGPAGQGFVEFFNTTAAPVSLTGYYLSDNPANLTKYQITGSLSVPANSYATIGFAESQLTVGATTTVYLTQPNGVTQINAISAAMPLDGRSLGRMPAASNSWFLFIAPTPNAPNAATAEVANQLRLNEAHFNSSNAIDWVELHNSSTAALPLAGLSLASLADFSDKVPLTGSIAANTYASVNVNFPADGSGDVVLYLIDSGNNVLGVAELERVPGRDSMQALYPVVPSTLPRWEFVRAQAEWYASPTHTRDAANNPPRTTDIVINEIMCDPPSGETSGEFIELYNIGANAVSLAGWKLRGGIDFDFPASASIPAGGYLVIAGNAAYIQQNSPPGATVIGDLSGSLGNNGDLIRLLDSFGNLADEVDYRVGGDWPELAGGSGSSLELINPLMDNNRASAWRDSDETSKTSFQPYSITGVFQQSRADGSPTDYKELHLFNAKDGYVALRNIAVKLNNAGANLLPNVGTISTTGSSANGWLVQGTHAQTVIDGSGVFHLIADGHGDVRPNRVEIDCTALSSGSSYTISFEARWLAGTPRIIAQTWDRSVGGAILLPVPNNLGTAGAANSRFGPVTPPQVDSILHSPAVPKPTDPVKVTARITSFAPLSAVELFHRTDTNSAAGIAYTSSPMFDNGTNGDAVAADGLYTATITAHQSNNEIVQFYVRATAQGGTTSQCPRDGPNRPAMWIVDSRTNIPTTLRRQRFIISAFDRDALLTASGNSSTHQFKYPRLSNHYFNITYIHNESDVYYLGEIHKSGSPWTRSDENTIDRGKWKLPNDRVFRDRQKSSWDNDATGGNRHHNRMIRYLLYLCGFPASNQEEFTYSLLNDDPPNVRNDTEPTDTDLLNRVWDNGNDGQLMQVEDEWWFTDGWSQTQRDADWSYKGTYDPIRYHTEYNLRTRETEYDFGPLIELFQMVNSGATEEKLNRVIDANLVMMVAAVRGYAGDWDSQTLSRGKNCYLYRKPTDGRWMYLHWDSDLAFGTDQVVGGLPGWGTYAGQTFTRRLVNYYLTELVNKYTRNSARTSAWMDAEQAAYTIDRNAYDSWFAGREARIIQEIDLSGETYAKPLAVTTTSGGSTPSTTVDLNGTAPSSAFQILVDGHPEAQLTWTSPTNWTFTGINLATGLNTLTVRTLDAAGDSIATTIFTITKIGGNAPPVMKLVADPQSLNIALGGVVTLDASSSFDPEAGALTYQWSHSPTAGATVSTPAPAVRTATFSIPGVYAFNATGTDPSNGSATITREVTAYSTEDFAPFNVDQLPLNWTVQNIERRDSYSASAWYSLDDKPNNLVLQILDGSAKTLAYNATHPTLLRPLPSSADWSLQTDLTLEARQTGSFRTGLYVEMNEGGAIVRYAFGLENGTSVTVNRLTSTAITPLGVAGATGSSAVLRIRRVGTQLRFERRVDDVWLAVGPARTLPANTTAVKGGLFASTDAPQTLRAAFDYLLLADPTNGNSLINTLRISEIMYSPKAPDTVEFIELTNRGTQPINLQGVRFGQSQPVDDLIFGNVTIAPGQFVVTIAINTTNAFRARYGNGAVIAGEWPDGALNNAGERIRLLDPDGNPIQDFSYDDVAPWPTSPKGGGPSLEAIDLLGDYDLSTNWRASFEIGGSPGYLGSGPDSDNDGMADSWELMFGTNPNDGNSRAVATVTKSTEGQPVISCPTVLGRSYRVEYTADLVVPDWQPLTTVIGTGNPLSFTDPTIPLPPTRFYHVVALP